MMAEPGTTAVARPVSVSLRDEPSAAAEWDAFVRTREGGTFCHRSGWADVLRTALGARPFLLEARAGNGTLTGILPLYRVRSALLGDYLVSVPFLNYGGALGDDEARGALAEAAVELGRELGVDAVELRSRKRERSSLTPLDRKVTVELPLPAEESELWSALPSKLRSQVRRPMKEGMEARRGAEEIASFHDVFARNMRDLGTPVLPRRFFDRAAAVFGDDVVVTTIRHDGRVVAGAYGFLHGDEFEITWASSLREFNSLSPNMLLYWELMRYAISRGARTFNFGRCTPGSGTHRFKLQWGGVEVPLEWSVWSRNGGDGTPKPDRPIFQLATAAWQKMPLWLANTIGPVLSRSLP